MRCGIFHHTQPPASDTACTESAYYWAVPREATRSTTDTKRRSRHSTDYTTRRGTVHTRAHPSTVVKAGCQSGSIQWRIDYEIATPGLAKLATSAKIERATAHAERWSDHAPVTVTFDI